MREKLGARLRTKPKQDLKMAYASGTMTKLKVCIGRFQLTVVRGLTTGSTRKKTSQYE